MPNLPDLHMHKKNPTSYWLAERIGAFLMFVFVLLGLVGLFGTGPISKTRVSGDGISLTYPRFSRNLSSVEIALELSAPANACVIDGTVLDELMIEAILPAPQREISLGNGDTKLEFAHDGGNKTLHVTLHVKPREWGTIGGRVLLENGVSLPINMTVLP